MAAIQNVLTGRLAISHAEMSTNYGQDGTYGNMWTWVRNALHKSDRRDLSR